LSSKDPNNCLYLYAMHRYDVIFFARLVDSFGSSHDSVLIITSYLYDEEIIRAFVQTKFRRLIVAPIKAKPSPGIVQKMRSYIGLRLWFENEINDEGSLVLLDKSDVHSRFFIKNFKNVVLIQQTETLNSAYRFDLKATILDLVRSLLLGSCVAGHYVNTQSDGIIRALKFRPCGKKDKFKIAYNVFGAREKSQFELPTYRIKKENKIVIFGSRFLSWPFFMDKKSPGVIKRLDEIFAFIFESFKSYEFYYVPHPSETGAELDHINKLFSGMLRVQTKFFSSEHFLYENRDIAFTFSIGSTSSASAYSMGFSAKVFYKMLDLPPVVESTYDDIFSSVPPCFFARSLTDLAVPAAQERAKANLNLFSELFTQRSEPDRFFETGR
jgi:hypothetical protein